LYYTYVCCYCLVRLPRYRSVAFTRCLVVTLRCPRLLFCPFHVYVVRCYVVYGCRVRYAGCSFVTLTRYVYFAFTRSFVHSCVAFVFRLRLVAYVYALLHFRLVHARYSRVRRVAFRLVATLTFGFKFVTTFFGCLFAFILRLRFTFGSPRLRCLVCVRLLRFRLRLRLIVTVAATLCCPFTVCYVYVGYVYVCPVICSLRFVVITFYRCALLRLIPLPLPTFVCSRLFAPR